LKRLEASCLLSGVSSLEHEDYQAEHAFRRILVMNFYGIDHAGRAFLALSQYVRYKGRLHAEVTAPVQKLLGRKMTSLAMTAGLAQRLGYLLTGGALDLLPHVELKLTPKQLVLKLNAPADRLNAGVIGDALRGLAESMGREAVLLTE
jgi:exopolyphosphatase/guanosine-5'-triphosphate,3'-diphosphate pyrophosphatase